MQLGDLYDLYSFSRFARSHGLMTPSQEVEMGRRHAENMWRELQAACPKAKCYQILGNHDARLAKRMMMALPEAEFLLEHAAGLWHFDGVETQPSEKDELIVGGVCFMHGYRTHGQHVTYNLMNTVVGHTHVGGVVYHRIRGKALWELNAGFLADPTCVPMSYPAQRRLAKYTQGVGYIDDLGPRFISLEGA